jgi:hypothetical protein
MLFKSSVFSQSSGSLGGTVFSHNRGGRYVRNRSTPTNPNSTGQQNVRANLSQAVAAWKNSLTATNRSSWDTYAANTPVLNKLGDLVNLTGQQMWIRTATAAYQIGLDPVTLFASAPTTFDLGDTGTLTFTSILDSNLFNVGVANTPDWAADDDARLIAFAGVQASATIFFYKAPFRFINAAPGDSGTPVTTVQYDLEDGYPSVSLTVGNVLFIRLTVLQSDGRLSNGTILRQVITS